MPIEAFAGPGPIARIHLPKAPGGRAPQHRVRATPGPRHWDIFRGVTSSAEARGNLVPDAWLAALAVEMGAELVTTDRDFSRFEGLRWRHPLD